MLSVYVLHTSGYWSLKTIFYWGRQNQSFFFAKKMTLINLAILSFLRFGPKKSAQYKKFVQVPVTYNEYDIQILKRSIARPIMILRSSINPSLRSISSELPFPRFYAANIKYMTLKGYDVIDERPLKKFSNKDNRHVVTSTGGWEGSRHILITYKPKITFTGVETFANHLWSF